MKILFIFLAILFNSSNLQDPIDCEVFVNDEGEVIVIDKDRISFRFMNRSGFITYAYFSGNYIINKENMYMLDEKDDGSYSEIQEVDTFKNVKENHIQLCLYDKGGEPIIYAPVVFDQSDNFEKYQFYSDELGCLLIPLSSNADSVINTMIEVLLLGNSFVQNIRIEKEKAYDVKLKVPQQYGIQNGRYNKRKYLTIEYLNEGCIRVHDSFLKERIFFRKDETRENCHEAIFED